jgi:hypothetical protein
MAATTTIIDVTTADRLRQSGTAFRLGFPNLVVFAFSSIVLFLTFMRRT